MRSYSPHGSCYLWDSDLILLHRVSDIAIAISYFAIPLVLAIFLIQRKSELGWRGKMVTGVTATFIVACGSTHIMGFWNITHSDYWLDGWIKLLTAFVSVPAAIIYLIGIKWFLSFRNPVLLLRELKELKERTSDYEKAKLELLELGVDDPAIALQTSHVNRLERQLKETRSHLDQYLEMESKHAR